MPCCAYLAATLAPCRHTEGLRGMVMSKGTRVVAVLMSCVLLTACAATGNETDAPAESIGRVTAFDPAFGAIVPADARIEKIAEGFTWAEGPAWIANGGYL